MWQFIFRQAKCRLIVGGENGVVNVYELPTSPKEGSSNASTLKVGINYKCNERLLKFVFSAL
jgi:hypothetical protein